MKKRTNKDQKFIDSINKTLAYVSLKDFSEEYIKGLAFTLELYLTQNGLYRGFRYLRQHEVREGELPGIRYDDENNFNFENTNPFRREYL